MPFNSSGPISLGGTTAGQSIELEINASSSGTNQISMNDVAVRTLLGPAGSPSASGTQISFSAVYGKNVPVLYTGSPSISTYGGNTIFVFPVGSATFTPQLNLFVNVVIVGGGAGGDYRYESGGGGGGGGGFQRIGLTLNAGTQYSIVVGAGGVGNGTTLAGATGGTSTFGSYSSTGGLPSGYSSGYNYGRGGSPGGYNGGLIPGGAGQTGITDNLTGVNYVYSSGGGAGGTTGGAGGTGAGNGGSTNQQGGNATNYGAGGGGGGYYSGSTYYYGGHGGSGVVIIAGDFRYT